MNKGKRKLKTGVDKLWRACSLLKVLVPGDRHDEARLPAALL